MSTTMDQQQKNRVRDALLADARAELQASVENVEGEHAAAEVVEDSSTSVDDISHADEAGDLAGLFEDSASRQTERVTQIEGIDFTVRDTVGVGSIVEIDGQRYVVGVVASPFEADGVSYEGISEDSPLYQAISGKRAGEEFTVNDRKQKLTFVA